MSGIDKFLSRLQQPKAQEPEEPAKRKRGRPRKAPHLRHPRSKDPDKIGKDGRLLPEHVKRRSMAGRRSPASKRRTKRRRSRLSYAKSANYQKAYRDSLKRKFYQHRSVGRRYAVKRGWDPAEYYQLDYAQFVLIWETAPMVYLPEKQCMVSAKSLINNPVKLKNQCTYLDRLDRTKPFTRENVRVFYRGRPL